jgi:VIT1/CCC1 family predicted Fe2+/Mn2+ transporter
LVIIPAPWIVVDQFYRKLVNGTFVAFKSDFGWEGDMRVKSEHSHDSDAIADRVRGKSNHSYLKDFVYGAIDGTVTTFAVVCGVSGAGLDSGIVIVLGLANLLGDGFSMAASNYLGNRTELQLLEKARAMEFRHIRDWPEGEKEEIRQIFAAKGFSGDDLDRAVEIITSSQELWVNTMLVDELGMTLEKPSPTWSAVTTFLAFCLVGLLPLLAYLFGYVLPMNPDWLFGISIGITALAFFLVGAAKSVFVDQAWYWSGAETLLVGGIAATLAYGVGTLLKGIV